MAELSTKQYISIRLGNDLYAIEIKYIENIIVMQNITRVPKAQSYFLGVINLRGEIIPVMSLKARLARKGRIPPTSRIIILKPERTAAPVGITVDEVNEVIDLSDEDIETLTYDDKEVKAAYSLGIGKYGSDSINILNVPELIGKDE